MSEQGLRDAHYRRAQALADVGSWYLDVEAENLRWSPECYRIFGIPEDEPVSYDRFLECVHPADQALVEDRWAAALEGEPYDLEHRILVDEAVKWVRERAEVEFDRDGTPVEAVGVVQDVTDRVEREAETRAARKRYENLLHSAPQPIFVADASTGEIVEANDAAAELRGQPRAEIIGLDQSDLHPSGEAAAYRELFERSVEEGGTWRETPDGSPIYACRADGERVPVEITTTTLELDSGRVTYGIFKDISDQQAREQELRGFRKAVEAAGHSIYITDTDGTIEYVNPAFEETTGYSKAEAVGKNPHILKSGVHPDSFYEEMWETISGGEVWESEVVNESKDGQRYVIDQTVAPVTDETGTTSRYVAVNSDITDIKRRGEMLEAERDRAEALRQRLSVVNRIIRHDVRSAVNVIEGNANLAHRRTDPTPHLETIREQAGSLHEIAEKARLIEETIAKPSGQRAAVDLAQTLEQLARTYQREYPEAAISWSLPDTARVLAHDRLSAAVEELLENAIRHNDVPTPSVRICLERKPGDEVLLTVEDDGPGIPDAELEPLGDGIEGALNHSSGLGLWIVYWVVQQSWGDLTFAAREPRGTRVELRLTAADARPA